MLGEALSLSAALVWASAIIFFRISVKGVSPLFLNLFKNTFATVLFFGTWMVTGLPFENLSPHDILLLTLSAIIGISLGDTFFLKSIQLLGAGRNAIVSCLFSPTVVLLSILFLNESLTISRMIGFSLVVLGIVLASYQKSEDELSKNKLLMGIAYGVLATTLMATGMIIVKPIVEDVSVVAVSLIRLSTSTIALILFYSLSGKWKEVSQSIQAPSFSWAKLSIGSFLGAYLALFLWVAGFKYTSASTASVLNQTSVFFTLLLAAIFLKERPSLSKIAGATLGFSGVLTILLL